MICRTPYLTAAALTVCLSGSAWSQTPPAPAAAPAEPITFVSAADITVMMAKAEAVRQPGKPVPNSPMLKLDPYTANLEYRTSIGAAAMHEKEAELFVVIEGSGSVVLGGKLVNETRRDAENLSGTAIEGGVTRVVAKGDMFLVAETVPHWFNVIDGTLVLMSLHIPRPVSIP
ncbi:MAG: cupin domain-containing protein [Steroidobacteraceae bacterium]